MRIILRCPKCKKTKSAKVDKTDPPLTAIVEIICPKCDDGDFHEASYYDARGNCIEPKEN